MKRLQYILAVVLFLLSTSLWVPKAWAVGTLSLSPTTETAPVSGELTVTIAITTGNDSINAVSAYLSYPADLLEPTSLDTSGSILGVLVEKTGTNGVVHLTGGLIGSGFTGQGSLGTVTFKVLNPGTASLTFVKGSHLVASLTNTDILDLTHSTGGTFKLTTAVPSSLTPAPVSDTISHIQVNAQSTQATVSWDTSTATDTYVEYGITSGLYPLVTSRKEVVRHHAIDLLGLTPLTKYYYRIHATPAGGNETTGSELSFTTLPESPPTGQAQSKSGSILFTVVIAGAIILVIALAIAIITRRKKGPPRGQPPPSQATIDVIPTQADTDSHNEPDNFVIK